VIYLSPLISPLQIALIIPKSIQATLFLIAIFFLNRRYPGINMRKRPQLHQFLICGLILWFTYIFLDIFIYTIAGLSFEANLPGVTTTYVGYTIEYPSLFVANILRDIGFIGAIGLGWIYLYAALLIQMGERKFEEKIFRNRLLNLLILSSIVIIVINDRMFVKISGDSINVSAVFNGISGFAILLTIITYAIGAFLLANTLRISIKEEKSPQFRKQIRSLILGMVFMGLGHSYWLILGQIASVNPQILGLLPILVWYYIGHGFWSASAVFIVIGFRNIKKDAELSLD
jgi:hypothetical protein